MNSLVKGIKNKLNILNKRVMGEEGSTLLLIMLSVAILSVLGAALISMSMMNISMKKSDMVVAQSKYYSESGIDQVYARVGDVVRLALDHSKKETDEFLKNEMDIIKEIMEHTVEKTIDNQVIVESDPTAHPLYNEYRNTKNYFDDSFNLNHEALANAAKEKYKELFKGYINNLIKKQNGFTRSLKEVLSDPYKNIEGSKSATISIGSCVDFDTGSDRAIIKDVESEFLYSDNTKKKIKTDIVIYDTGRSYPLRTVQKVIKVKDNPIWQNTLVANGDIKLELGSEITSEGNVFAMGKKGNNINDPKTFGGFIVKDSSEAIIKGNIVSRQYVQLAQNSTEDALIDLDNGFIHANTLIAQEGSRGEMIIDGDVFTKDDLELNGLGCTINIDGSYYGYSDGSGSLVTHDNSSAIVINAKSDSINYPNLNIRGEKKSKRDKLGAMVWGTAHLDGTPDFQTAESVAFKENAFVYTWKFDEAVTNSIIASDFLYGPGRYKVYSNASERNTRVDKYIKNPSWQTIQASNGNQFQVANGTTDGGSKSDLKDRKAYFLAFQKYVDTANDLLYTGNGKINIDKYIYTTGLRLGPNSVDGKYFNVGIPGDQYNDQDVAGAIRLRKDLEKEYLYILHYMKREDFYNENPRYFRYLIDKLSGSHVESANGDRPTIDNANPVEKYTKLDTVMNELSFTTINEAPSATSRVVKNFSATNDELNIYGKGYSGTSDINNIYYGDSSCEGIIVRKGNINIYGDIELNGVIITEGDITFKASKSKIINKYKKRMAKMIHEDERLTDLFNVSRYGFSSSSGKVRLGDFSFKEVSMSTDNSNVNNNNTMDYDRYIAFKHWRVVE